MYLLAGWWRHRAAAAGPHCWLPSTAGCRSPSPWPASRGPWTCTNHRSVFRTIDQSQISIQDHSPITDQYSGPLTNFSSVFWPLTNLSLVLCIIDQSEVSILDQWPIRSQYYRPVTNHSSVFWTIDQSEVSITRRSPWRCPRAGQAAAPCLCWTATCTGNTY